MPITADRLIRSHRKTIALVVERDGSLTVRAPLHMALDIINSFISSHQDWIRKSQARARLATPPPPRQFTKGESFLLLGKSFPLEIVPTKRPSLKFDGTRFLLARSALPQARETFIRWYRREARHVLTRRASALAEAHKFTFTRIRISSARTRWGSCSSLGTLSFPWRLILAPPQVVDYVILHELVHTRIRNHSQAFWQELEKLEPACRQHVRWLKEHGSDLTL